MLTLRTPFLVATLCLSTFSSHQLFGMQENMLSPEKITYISNTLKKNKNHSLITQKTLKLMEDMYKNHGGTFSANSLKAAQDQAGCYLDELIDNDGENILQNAMGRHSPNLIKMIFELSDYDNKNNASVAWSMISWCDPSKDEANSAWHMAVESGQEAIVDVFINFVLSSSLALKSLFTLKDNKGRTVLHCAAAQGNVSIFHHLLKTAIKRKLSLSELLAENDKNGHSLLTNAYDICYENHADEIHELIQDALLLHSHHIQEVIDLLDYVSNSWWTIQ